jgi:two-component system OmpR family response regulator
MRLLLVEDDPDLRARLRSAFRREHFIVDAVEHCSMAADHVRDEEYDLVLLDHLAGCDSVDACRRIRDGHLDVPIMVVTERDDVDDRIRALDSGADGCLVKPLDVREAVAHARALLRRGRTRHLDATLEYGPLRLDPGDRTATLDGRLLALSATEYRLLRYLMLRAEAVVTRHQLLQHVWGGTLDSSSNTPDMYLSYLRQKLAPAGQPLIHTVRGLGYTLRLSRGSSARTG